MSSIGSVSIWIARLKDGEEAVLADLMIQGCSLESAADRLCVSIHTARTHLKRILLKTDTGRQAELLRLMFVCAGVVALD